MLGRLASFRGVGRLIGVLLGGLLYDLFGTRPEGWGFESGVLFFSASGIIFASILPMLTIPEGGAPKYSKNEEQASSSAGTGTMGLFVAFLVGMIFIHWGRNSIAVIRSPYMSLDEGFNISPFSLSLVLNTEAMAAIVTGLCIGFLSRRVEAGRLLLVSSGLSVIALAIYVFAAEVWLIYMSSVLRGCANALIMASSYTFVSVLIPPEKRGRLFSYFNATLYLSWGVAATAIAGPVVDYLSLVGWREADAYRAAFGTAAGLTAVGLAIQCYVVLRMYPRVKP